MDAWTASPIISRRICPWVSTTKTLLTLNIYVSQKKKKKRTGHFRDISNKIYIACFGDFGFDPLRLGEVPENLERFKESELIHRRWAMLAVVSDFKFKHKKKIIDSYN